MAESQEGKYLKTSELIKRSGLTRQMIYEYISLGLIREAKRTGSGHRLFDERTVTEAKLVQQLCASGYTLRAIRDIFVEGRGRKNADETRISQAES